MADVKWMDFSGAPPILIPEEWLSFWNGYYVEDDDLPDLELPDGRGFSVWDEFDFDDPKTDYDRICAHKGGSFLHPVGPGLALVISDYSDGTVGWWADQNMLITVSRFLPDPACFDRLEWSDEIRWRIPGPRLVLMNSCLHGADPNKPTGDHCEIELPAGEYSILQADHQDEICAMLYRFRRVGP